MKQGQHMCYVLDDAILEQIERDQLPTTSVLIGLTKERSFDRVRNWLQAGADDVIVVPEEIEQLMGTLTKIKNKRMNEREAAEELETKAGHGRVRAFYSAKGGSGKTLLATMFAQNLQLQCHQRVVLIDWNVQFGGLDVVLGMAPQRSYVDLIPVIQELSITHIENVAMKEETTDMTVLFSPANPERTELVTEELVTRVIQTCKANFDQVILDLPSDLNTVSYTALNHAQDIYYVMNPDSLSVRSLKRAVSLFRRFQIGHRGNLSLILNRKNHKSELTEKDIAQLVDIPIIGSVRADFFGIQPLLNMGQPFYSKQNDKGTSKVAQDVRLMTRKMIASGV